MIVLLMMETPTAATGQSEQTVCHRPVNYKKGKNTTDSGMT